jgi:predicted outer membrane repeat protein
LTDATLVDGGGIITLDAQGLTRHFTIIGAQSQVELRGLALQNGSVNGFGGAIRVSADTSLQLTDCILFNNAATASGGALYVESDASVGLLRTQVRYNRALNGGGIASSGTLTITDSIGRSGRRHPAMVWRLHREQYRLPQQHRAQWRRLVVARQSGQSQWPHPE